MENNLKLCMGCMCHKEYSGPCEMCGYMDNTAYLPSYLAPRTVLMNRYIVGRLLSHNGEGAVYIAYDTEKNKVVEIKEYMPDLLCTRKKNERQITVNPDALPLYKSYLSEFADLYKSLMNNIETDCVQKIYGIFSENNTGYVVMEHLTGMPLSEYLEKTDGIMVWEKAKEIFPPLFTTLNLLHSATIVHRGLSPDSVFIDNRGRLKLTAFGISASRTADQSLNCELFSGYAAPEQYSVSERQGPWTDIYGICALLYRVLTGITPQSAEERLREDTIAEPFLVNHDVPHNVSRGIMAGLIPDSTARIHNMNLLVSKLFEQPKENDVSDGPVRPAVAVENIPSPVRQEKTAPKRKPQQKSTAKSKKNKKKSSNVGTIIGFSVFLAIVAGFIIAIIYFSDQTNQPVITPAQTTATTTKPQVTTPPVTTAPPVSTTTEEDDESGEKILLPNFVDRFYNTLESRYSILIFEPVYEYNADYAVGIVFEQDIPEGTEVTSGTVVTLKISKGPDAVALPDYVGKKVKDYTKELEELGIRYETEKEETTEFKKNYVVRCDKEIGDMIKISEDETVIVYYAVVPEKTEAQTEEAPSDESQPSENSEGWSSGPVWEE